MEQMFNLARNFNGAIALWDTSTIQNMRAVFSGAWQFNQPIGVWNTSSVTTMQEMFFDAEAFDSPIGNWNVAQVTNMSRMFSGADVFNQDISSWTTSNVTNMSEMFIGAPLFNQDISTWNTGSATDMSQMFRGAASFDQNLGGWNISQVTTMENMLNNTTGGLSMVNYDATLIGWAGQTVQNGVNLGANGLTYCDGETARQNLIDNSGWNITGDTRDAGCDACTVVRFADDTLRAFLVNDANNGNFLDQNNQPVDLDPTGSGNVCVQEAVKVVSLDVSGLGLVSLMGSNIDLNNPISAASSPDAANPTDPTNGLIAFSNLTELVISNNNFDNGLQVPNGIP